MSNSANSCAKSKTEREELLTRIWGTKIAKVIVDDNESLYPYFTTVGGLYDLSESDWEALILRDLVFMQLWEKVKANDEYWLNRLQNDYGNSVSEFCRIRGIDSIPPYKLINAQPKFIDLFYNNKELIDIASATASTQYDICALLRSLFVQTAEGYNWKAFKLFEDIFNSREIIGDNIYEEQIKNEELNKDKFFTDVKKYGYACYAFLYKNGIVVEKDEQKSAAYAKFALPYRIVDKTGFLVGDKAEINKYLE